MWRPNYSLFILPICFDGAREFYVIYSLPSRKALNPSHYKIASKIHMTQLPTRGCQPEL
jgi:hypothetical protein